MPFELTIQERGGASRTQVVAKEIVFIGRREDNDVILPFAFISSRHGRIFRRNGGLFVEDMGSTNGILVNGSQLTPMTPRAIRPEDVLQIEKIAIRARWVEGTAEPAASGATFHEALGAALPAPPAPAPPPRTPPRIETPATMFEMQSTAGPVEPPAEATGGTVRLAQATLPEVLASARLGHRLRAQQTDDFGVWVVFFKALGLLALFGSLVLFVLVMFV